MTVDIAYLLYEACTKLGYCLPPNEQRRLIERSHDDVDSFTDAVLRAEGLDPTLEDREQRKALLKLVARHFRSS